MKLIFTLLFIFVSLSVSVAEPNEVLTPDQVTSLLSIQDKSEQVYGIVGSCMEAGLSYSDCMCAKREQVIEYNKDVAEFFASYPVLAGYDRVRFLSTSGDWITLDLEWIRQQSSSDPVCK